MPNVSSLKVTWLASLKILVTNTQISITLATTWSHKNGINIIYTKMSVFTCTCFLKHNLQLMGWLFLAFFSVKTSLTSYSGNQTVNEGSNLTLCCNTTGKPTPNVTWTRVLKNGTDGDVVFFGNCWGIVNISRTATGTYRCIAYNGIGNPVNHSLDINVTCKYRHGLFR